MMTKRSADEFDLNYSSLANDPDYEVWRQANEQEWLRDMERWESDYNPEMTAKSWADDLGTVLGLGPRKN